MKKPQPANFPTMKCTVCGAHCRPYEKFSCDAEGRVFLTGVDMWPEYFRDVDGHRHEFCSAHCGLRYCEQNSLTTACDKSRG
jgi:hypothetical protein